MCQNKLHWLLVPINRQNRSIVQPLKYPWNREIVGVLDVYIGSVSSNNESIDLIDLH